MNLKIIIFSILAISFLNINILNSEQKFVYYNDLILKNAPKELHNLKVLEEDDLSLEVYRKYFPRMPKRAQKADIEGYRSGGFKSFIEGDFNNNGKRDIVLACIEPSRENSYILIFEEQSKDDFKFIKYFKFHYFVVFISGERNNQNDNWTREKRNELYIGFQAQTDWVESIIWNGRRYIIEPKDPYGP